jgi:hypothetical protein
MPEQLFLLTIPWPWDTKVIFLFLKKQDQRMKKEKKNKTKKQDHRALVAHTCNPIILATREAEIRRLAV